ncbi:MAG: fused MFS/spermidine synthase [bacterium]
MASRHGSTSLAATLYVCSFVSGVAALGYEVVWTKSLSLTFGATRLAAGAVLAGFLGGMGLGARAYPALLARFRRPIRTYALLEIGIAATALPLTLLLPRLPGLFAKIATPAGGDASLVALRFVFALLLLLVPCALMGATFPALSVILIRSESALARHLGLLYGLNTLGAALGAALAGIVSIEALGLRGTVLAGNLLNLAVAAIVLRRAAVGDDHLEGEAERRAERALQAERGAERADLAGRAEPAERIATRLPRALTGAVIAGSGLATLAYEIVWFRALTYLFGNSTYAFTTMLFVFLLGLGAGPFLFRPIARRPHPERALALCQLGIAVFATAAIGIVALAVGSLDVQERVSIFFQTFFNRPWPQRLLIDAAVAFVAMFPATLLMGLSFPLATSLFLGDLRRLAPRLGNAVLLANAGSIAGALGGALFVLPIFGTAGGTRAIAAVNLALGVAVLTRTPTPLPRRLAIASAALAATLLVAVALPSRVRFTVAGAVTDHADLLYEKEGDLATVQVWRDRDRPEALGMAIDGTTIGATREWGSTLWTKQVLLAHLPFALDDRLRDVMTIGLGSGSTVEALLEHPGVRSVDVVEINAPVMEGCRYFPYAASLADPRVSVVVDDALQFLQRSPRRWDAIVSDGKEAMSFAGTAKLLTREFYERCRADLTDDGLLVQWVPLAIGAEEYRMIVRTLGAVFENVDVFFEPPSHVLFVASARALEGRPRDGVPFGDAASRDLAELGIEGAAGLRARWVADARSLATTVGEGPLNTWDRPRLEFTGYKLSPARWGAETAEMLASMERASSAAESTSGAQEFASGADARALRVLRVALGEHVAGRRDRASVFAMRALAAAPSDPVVRLWAQRIAGGPGAALAAER